MHRQAAAVLLVIVSGCNAGSAHAPLGAGATPPKLAAEGWLNGAPDELQPAGRVTVVETWAYW